MLLNYNVDNKYIDKTNYGKQIDVKFNGKLYDEQDEAFKALNKFDMGVLSATTAFGKTVIGAKLIVEKKVNTKESNLETMYLLIAIVMFVVGIVGTILPALPGVILIFGGMFLYGFMTNFAELSIYFFVMQLVVMLLIFLVDFLASAVSTKKYGGSKQAAIGAGFGTILGIIVFGPLGVIIGPFAGSVITEIIIGKEIDQAIRVGFGSLVGVIGGTIFKLIAEAVMIIYFFMKIL